MKPPVIVRRLATGAAFSGALWASGCAQSAAARPAPAAGASLKGAIAVNARTVGIDTAMRALYWSGDATVEAGGRVIQISGTWAIQPPDSAVVTTWETSKGPSTARSLVIAAPRGWIVTGDTFEPLPEPVIANERDEFYLYTLLRLSALLETDVTLESAPADAAGRSGVRATRPGRPTAELWFDDTGRLAHARMRVHDASGGAPIVQDAYFEGEQGTGFRWPVRLRLTNNGAPYFTLTMREVRLAPRLASPLLAGPR